MLERASIVKNSFVPRRLSGISGLKHFRRNLKNTLLSKIVPLPTQEPTLPNEILYVVGMFSTANGIGEAARSAYEALSSTGTKVIPVDISSAFDQVDFASGISCIHYSNFPSQKSGTLLLYMNGAEVLYSLNKLGLRKKHPWKVIGVWVWELPSFPQSWQIALPFVSEVWTYSHFSKRALQSQHSDIKITVVPPPINASKSCSRHDYKLEIPSNRFTLLTMCDARSGIHRKNPIGAINAFKLAFEENQNLFLIVKTRNFDEDVDAVEALESAIANHDGILWIDGSLPKDNLAYLFEKADCFISLHKSEGFGLAMAQAMMAGKPCIASAWSANLDYMDEECALLVPCQKVPVDDEDLIATCKEAYWGEPDIKVATAHMLEISKNEELYETIVKQAKLRITPYCDPNKLGRRMIELLTKPDSN